MKREDFSRGFFSLKSKMSAGDQIWSNLSIDALSILATSELINKDIENAIESEQKLDYDPDTRYKIAGRYLNDYLESFTSNHKSVSLFYVILLLI